MPDMNGAINALFRLAFAGPRALQPPMIWTDTSNRFIAKIFEILGAIGVFPMVALGEIKSGLV